MNNESLLKYDSETCDTTFIGYLDYSMFDIAVTPSGRLFGTTSEELYEIDTTDATCTFIATIFPTAMGTNNLFALNDTFLLTTSFEELYKINVNDGSKQLLGSHSLLSASSGDITYLKGYYYLARGINQLVRFRLNASQTSLLNVELVGTMNTPHDAVWGVLTVGSSNCEEDNLRMLAFEGWSVYYVNEKNAQCSLVCDSISNSAVMGAASLAESSQQISKAELTLPNVFTPNNDGVNDFFCVRSSYNINELEIIVLNRWGQEVFNATSSEFKWNGENYTNTSCSDGVYFYATRYSDMCGQELVKHGNITLIR